MGSLWVYEIFGLFQDSSGTNLKGNFSAFYVMERGTTSKSRCLAGVL